VTHCSRQLFLGGLRVLDTLTSVSGSLCRIGHCLIPKLNSCPSLLEQRKYCWIIFVQISSTEGTFLVSFPSFVADCHLRNNPKHTATQKQLFCAASSLFKAIIAWTAILFPGPAFEYFEEVAAAFWEAKGEYLVCNL
jgi:hypothetical protein